MMMPFKLWFICQITSITVFFWLILGQVKKQKHTFTTLTAYVIVKIIAGMDVSGDTHTGNHKFMAVVLGAEEQIYNMVKQHPTPHSHISKISNPYNRDRIATNLIFDNKSCCAICVRIDRDDIIKKFVKKKKAAHCNMTKTKIRNTYHCILLGLIRKHIVEFLYKHSLALSDMTFQCDGDCKRFAKDSGLHYDAIGIAYQLSDTIAWLNNKDQEPKGVIQMDVRGALETHWINILNNESRTHMSPR